MKIKISSKKIYQLLKDYYRWILGVVFVLLLCLNIFIYYQYVYLIMKAEPEPAVERVVVEQEILQKVLENIQSREENLSRAKKTQYADPFR